MLWPCDRAYLGRLPEASSPYDGELYEAWAARMGVPADPLADPDNDGVSNLMECALGTDPAYREGQGWDILPGSPPVMRVLWPCFVPPNLWRDVEGSNDLEQWTSSDLKAECDEGPATLSLFSWKYARFIVRKL